jgi:hypothetical protein
MRMVPDADIVSPKRPVPRRPRVTNH